MHRLPAFLILVSVLLPCPIADAEIIVRLAVETEVRGETVLLGTLAEIEADAETRETLQNLPISPSPGLGQRTTLRRAFVERAIAAVMGDLSAVRIEGPDSFYVTRRTVTVSSEELLEPIDTFIRKRMIAENLDFEVVWPREPRSIAVSDENYEIAVEPLTNGLRGMVHFRISVTDSTGRREEALVPVEIRHFDYALVARSFIARGEPITSEKIEPARLDITRMSSRDQERLVQTMEGILGKEARTSIAAGRPIQSDLITEPRIVTSGEPVTIEIHRGTLRLSAPGIARQHGSLGQSIRIENRATGRTQYAIVTGPGLVSLQ